MGMQTARQGRGRPLTLEPLEDRLLLSVYTVDHLTDDGQGSGLTGDLRYCITQATDGDTITFAVTGTIDLQHPLPVLGVDLAIKGPGASLLTVDAHLLGTVFYIEPNATVTISGLRMTHGLAINGDGGIANFGTLTLDDCVVYQNVSRGYLLAGGGGGIGNAGVLIVRRSTIANNVAEENDFSKVSEAYGGGIYNSGSMTITDSTIAGNSAGGVESAGAGIYNWQGGTLTITNSTIADNRNAHDGGGIFSSGTLTLANSTVANNHNVTGSATYGGGLGNSGTASLHDTIVANNTATDGPDLFGVMTSAGYNLFGQSTGGSGYVASDLLNIDPMLGPLADNGGPTQTMALLPGSPAIDAGDNTGAPRWDQRGRGYHRIVNGRIDIGAFEVQPDDMPMGGSAPVAVPLTPPGVEAAFTQPPNAAIITQVAGRPFTSGPLGSDQAVVGSSRPLPLLSPTHRRLSHGAVEAMDGTDGVSAVAMEGFNEPREP